MLARKSNGTEARMSFMGHLATENRNGMIVAAAVSRATGTAERDMAPELLEGIQHRQQSITAGADKGYDTRGCVGAMRGVGATPHVARREIGSAIDGRTTSREGYASSQCRRKLIEQCFGWMKTIGPVRQPKLRGLGQVDWIFMLTATAYNLVRIKNLTRAAHA
jgi:IS5 family transposase